MTHKQIIEKALLKMSAGARKYGKWQPGTDKRDLLFEMQDELLDVINYAVMQIQKLENLKKLKKLREAIQKDVHRTSKQ